MASIRDKKLYLGLVGTARTSQVAVATEDGKIISVLSAPPLTIRVTAQLSHYLRRTFSHLADSLDITFSEMANRLHSVCISMSGVFLPLEHTQLRRVLRQTGFVGSFDLITCEDVNAHFAANFMSYGGVVIAGTGTNVVIRGHEMAKPIRVDGWGSVLGDEGGGYDLGIQCLRFLLKGEDKRLTRSEVLEKKILNHIGLSSIKEIVPWYYDTHDTLRWRSSIADIAIPLVKLAEEDNNLVALQILREGAEKLLNSVQTAVKLANNHKKHFRSEPVPLVLEGGMFRYSETYVAQISDWLSKYRFKGIKWKPMKSQFEPVLGALVLAFCGKSYLPENYDFAEALKESAERNGLRIN